jgi:hypothetical protein
MPLPKVAVLQSNSSIAKNNDWAFAQTQAPSKGPGVLPVELLARIAPGELPKSVPTDITGNVAGYAITQQGRHKTGGTITIKITEGSDGKSGIYFESLKGLNNPRDSSGNLSGKGYLENEKEGEYTIVQNGADGKQFRKHVIKQAVVTDVTQGELSDSEEGAFVVFTVTFNYKDNVILGPNNQVLS